MKPLSGLERLLNLNFIASILFAMPLWNIFPARAADIQLPKDALENALVIENHINSFPDSAQGRLIYSQRAEAAKGLDRCDVTWKDRGKKGSVIKSVYQGPDHGEVHEFAVDVRPTPTNYVFFQLSIEDPNNVPVNSTNELRLSFLKKTGNNFNGYNISLQRYDPSNMSNVYNAYDVNDVIINNGGVIELDDLLSQATGETYSYWRLSVEDKFDDGLRLHYDFNRELPGEDDLLVRDSSGNGNDGFVYNAVWIHDGKRPQDGAFVFNGVDSYIEVQDSPSLSPSNSYQNMTVTLWMRPDTFSFTGEAAGYVHLLGKGEPGNYEWMFRLYNSTAWDKVSRSKRVSFYTFNLAGGLGTGSYFQDNLAEGEWVFAAGVVDGTTTKIYSNGILRDADWLSNYDICMGDGKAPLRIGTTDFDSWFSGAIDDVRVYDRALDDEEIAQIYREGI